MGSRGDHFQFGSVFIKKSNQTEIFLKKNRNWVKPTGFNSVRFGFLGKKPVQTGFGLVFPVLARFFSCFFRFRFGSVFSVFCL
jgi:hypothetical protein